MNAIITARYSSLRLPGKVLLEINGIPSLQRTVDSLRESEYIDEIIVATSDNSPQIVSYCVRNGIEVFSYKNEEDCLSRLYHCTLHYQPRVAIRVWGDCPLINVSLIDTAIEKFRDGILYTEGYPKGWDFYVFDVLTFREIYNEMTPIEKYHWNNFEEISCWHGCSVEKLISPIDLSELNYSLDTLGDLERLNKICKSME